MKLLIAGDFCPRYRVADRIKAKDYSYVLKEVRLLTQAADYAILNFECPVVIGDAQPIEKIGPNLRCTYNAVEAVKWAGFQGVTLANNHFLDYGEKGVSNTLDALKNENLDYVGGGMNIREADRVLYKKINGKKLAIINCCEHEFSIASDNTPGTNPLNPIHQYHSIQEVKKEADYVVVIVHGGHEHFQLPSFRMVETYRFFIDAGADVVVNHHQHCYSGYEVYNGKPIFYGLGNFCFDNQNLHSGKWTEGYAVTIIFSNPGIEFSIHPYSQCAEDACIRILSPDAFKDRIDELNRIIANKDMLKEEIDKYYGSCSGLNSWLFEPIQCGLYYKLRYKGLLPSLVSKERKISATNLILCESHLDKMKWWLDH